ncbi:Fungalysin/Thermolysin Extracellular metalloproteinase 5 [Serendipita sp. 411]|nr:Fungalysin/Thermolysin Extracellular metalloproteinase 5 [Serendipita sp. 411]
MFRPAYLQASGQTPMIARHQEQISQIHESNCLVPEANLKAVRSTEYSDPARAALTFMILATPSTSVSDDIASNFDNYLAGITYQSENHFVGTSGNEGDLMFPVDYLHNVPGTVNPVRARLAYVQTPAEDDTTELALVWKLEVEMENNWYEAAVRVADPSVIVEVVDWASDAGTSPERLGGSYNVWKWGINDPECGDRSVEESPYDEVASPLGWHSLPASKDARSRNMRWAGDPILNITQTYGNNVYAHEDWAGRNDWLDNYRPDGGKDLVFDYDYELHMKNGSWASPKSYINLTITQLFYTVNKIHDIYYRYGFDEVSGNFQQYNFDKGGKENDAVIANAQDGSGYNRWGDLIATIVRSTEDYQDYSMGSWAANETNGIRNYVYSTNMTTNPSTYKTLDKGGYWGVHAIGEVWAEILWIVYNNLVTKHGYSKTLFPPVPDKFGVYPVDNDFFRPITYDVETKKPHKRPIPKNGNTLMMQLVLDGMKLQPCRPGFMEARDAIIQADEILTGGENFCLLWDSFAKRGLGTDATVTGRTPWGGGVRHDGHAVPKACRKGDY